MARSCVTRNSATIARASALRAGETASFQIEDQRVGVRGEGLLHPVGAVARGRRGASGDAPSRPTVRPELVEGPSFLHGKERTVLRQAQHERRRRRGCHASAPPLISAILRQVHTTSSRWLIALCAKVTMPDPGAGFARAGLHHLGLDPQRIAEEDRLRHDKFVVAQIRHQHAERGFRDRDADHQAEREGAR